LIDDSGFIDDDTRAELQSAYEAVLPELREIPVQDVAWVDQNVVEVASVALAAIPKIQSLRAELGGFGDLYRIDRVDNIERYAKAALYADRAYRENPEPEGSLPALVEQAAVLRVRLATDCDTLIEDKLLDKQRFNDLDGGIRYEFVACDLLLIRAALTAIYPKVKDRVSVTLDDLLRAEELANAIFSRLSDPHATGPLAWEPAEMRCRAYTGLTRAYGEACRGVNYVRWHHEDAEEFTPDLMSRSLALLERRRFARQEPSVSVRDAACAPLAMVALTLVSTKRGSAN